MRLLFLFVLLVNVVFVSWEISQLKDESAAPDASTEIPTIELLSEIGQATKNPTEIPTKVLAKVEAKPAKTAPVGKSAKPDKPPEVKPPVVVVQSSSVDRCYTLGPFRKLDNLRTFTRAIKDYVSAASFRSREEQEQSLFWVFLESEATLKKAKKLANSLKNKKVKDYYVISNGPKENGISLGHFKEKDRAYSHAASITALGFKPVVEPVFRSYTIYWLDYHVPAGKVIPQKIFSKYLAQKINRLDRACS